MRSLAFSVLLLGGDQELHDKIQRTLDGLMLTVARDVAAIPRAALKQGFDAVLIEARRGALHEFAEISRVVEPSRTMIVMGSRSVLARSAEILQTMMSGPGRLLTRSRHTVVLEEIIESKLGEFVKGMRNGSARDLHPMLISAVERPLIAHALKATNGNQIQAAHLLGMNRNTLRKKITEFRIPVRRHKAMAGGAT